MTDRERRIRDAVGAWRADKPGAGDKIALLAEDERKEALRRLGYSTPAHLEMFGL